MRPAIERRGIYGAGASTLFGFVVLSAVASCTDVGDTSVAPPHEVDTGSDATLADAPAIDGEAGGESEDADASQDGGADDSSQGTGAPDSPLEDSGPEVSETAAPDATVASSTFDGGPDAPSCTLCP